MRRKTQDRVWWLNCVVTFGAFTLVRHAMPHQVPDEDPSTWRLGPEGLAGARRLSNLVPSDTYLVASPEPKAAATALLITGREPALDVRLVEVRRPSDWNSAHLDDAQRYLGGEEVTGWERRHDVVQRFDEAVYEHSELAGSRRMVVVGHGISASLWIAARLGLDPVDWWKSLRFPDAWEIDVKIQSAHRLAEVA